PAPFDLDARDDRRAGRSRALGRGEAAHVIDCLVERRPVGPIEPIARDREVARFQDQSTILGPAAEPLVCGANRVGSARPDVIEDGSRAGPDELIGYGAAPAEGAPFGHVGRIGRREVQTSDRREVGGSDGPAGGRIDAHGTIFSIGRTRMPEAPAALRRGSSAQTSSAPTTAWIAIIPACASGITDGESSPGRSVSSSPSRSAGAFIIRYLRSRAAMTALSIVSTAASSAARWTWAVGLATRIASDVDRKS